MRTFRSETVLCALVAIRQSRRLVHQSPFLCQAQRSIVTKASSVHSQAKAAVHEVREGDDVGDEIVDDTPQQPDDEDGYTCGATPPTAHTGGAMRLFGLGRMHLQRGTPLPTLGMSCHSQSLLIACGRLQLEQQSTAQYWTTNTLYMKSQ